MIQGSTSFNIGRTNLGTELAPKASDVTTIENYSNSPSKLPMLSFSDVSKIEKQAREEFSHLISRNIIPIQGYTFRYDTSKACLMRLTDRR